MKIILQHTIFFSLLLSAISFSLFAEGFKENPPPALFSFSTEGYSVYHLESATINSSGSRVIISAAFDGTVLCHSQQGELIWKNQINKDFPFDLATADINNDGFDESFIATAGGKVFAFSAEGSLLWTYTNPAPLYQVCPVKLSNGDWRIITGGIEEEIINLSASGIQMSTLAAGHVVRHLRRGNIKGDGKEYIAVGTDSGKLAGNLSLMLLDPNTMTTLWTKNNLGTLTSSTVFRFWDMLIADTDKDGMDNVIFSTHHGNNGLLYGFDETGTQMLSNTTNNSMPYSPYRMNMLSNIDFKDTDTDFIFGIYGHVLVIYNADGSFNSFLESHYDFSNACFDRETNTYYLGSSPSGGDGIYAFNLNDPEWKTAFKQIKPVGKLAEVEKNLAELTQQVNNFVKPDYQREPANAVLFTKQPNGDVPANLLYGSTNLLTQVKIPGELWCKNTDNRYAYNLTQEQILTKVRQNETNKQYFSLWVGHGTAVYMSPSTLEAVLREAPVYFQGFVFTEMEQSNDDMKRVVNEIIFPLAEKCSAAGKKIIFLNKNIFWSGSCYQEFWRNVLLNPQFHDVFVPSLEETNSRSQELSLSGRVGLWMTGYFDKWSARAVSDDACFNRQWHWSAQQVMSHYIRKLAMSASLGADIFLIDINQASTYSNAQYLQLKVLYDMLAKGVIAIPAKEDILSISDVCLGMKVPPSQFYLDRGQNGHYYNFPTTARTPMVFDNLDCYWGAAPLQDHDFSSYGYGVDRRMLNFLPKNPFGLVTIVPDNIDLQKHPWLKEKITTDGMNFFDPMGMQQTPLAYKETVISKLEAGAERLAVWVKGDVAWTVVRLDPVHVRITLFDPGYTDPAKRQAEITLQNLIGTKATDILNCEDIEISNQKIYAEVPAGSLRIIDLKHEPVSVENKVVSDNILIFPNPSTSEFTVYKEKIPCDLSLNISDIYGKSVLYENYRNVEGEFIKKFSLPEKGIYILKIEGKNVNYATKIIIQ